MDPLIYFQLGRFRKNFSQTSLAFQILFNRTGPPLNTQISYIGAHPISDCARIAAKLEDIYIYFNKKKKTADLDRIRSISTVILLTVLCKKMFLS